MDHPGVAREDRTGDQRLVAYLVARSGATMDAADLREHLKASLPDYMLPQHVVELDAIPLLPNGKVNRQALPVPNADPQTRQGGADFAVPANATELAIAAIWARLLGVAQVGRHDNFFNLGGHSLLALRAVLEIQRITGEKIAVRRLIFESLSQIAATVAVEPPLDASTDALAAEVDAESVFANPVPMAPSRPHWLKRLWPMRS
jgi:hypothetical protein